MAFAYFLNEIEYINASTVLSNELINSSCSSWVVEVINMGPFGFQKVKENLQRLSCIGKDGLT